MATYDSKGNLLTTLSYDVLSKYKNKIFVETGTSSGHGVEIALKY